MFFYKLFKSVITSSFSLISLPLVTRTLGPVDFGNFNFIKQFFDRVFEFLDIGTSASAPFVTLNYKQKSIYKYLSLYYLLIGLTSFSLILILLKIVDYKVVFHVSSELIIVLILFLSFSTIVYNRFSILFDAIGQTVQSEVIQIGSKFIIFIFILFLFHSAALDLVNFVTVQLCLSIIAIVFFAFFYLRRINPTENNISLISVYKHFLDYSLPIWGSTFLIAISNIFERWLLQNFSGSEQQGFFSLGVYVGAIPLLITGAFTPILLRQYTINSRSLIRLRYLFQKYSSIFFVISTIPSCFFALNSEYLIYLFGGEAYKGAYVAVVFLCLSPIHQTYGQLTGALMMATGKTKEYSRINVISMLVGLGLTLILLAPKKFLGLNLGADGLAFKLFILQIFSVNLQIIFVSRYLNITYLPIFLHQLYVVLFFFVFGFTLKYFIGMFDLNNMFALIINTVFYFSGILFLAFYNSELLGVNNKVFFQIVRGVKKSIF